MLLLNLADYLSTTKKPHLNQFGSAASNIKIGRVYNTMGHVTA